MADHERIDLFLNILNLLKDGSGTYSNIDSNFKQVCLAEKDKVTDFFKAIIDQPAFMSNDHKRLRKFLIDWYASNRALVTQGSGCTDPYNLSSEELNELIRSFGFPYPEKILYDIDQNNNRKAQFILDCVDLYHKKGTPESIVTSLQTYFGVSSIVLNEWWIHRNALGLFVARSKPIYPRNSAASTIDIPYSSFVSNDPLWQLSETELDTAYENNIISLPSITPYISLQSLDDTTNPTLTASLAIIARECQEAYYYWLSEGTLDRQIGLTGFTNDYSILEIFLAFAYLFNSDASSSDENFVFYNGDYAPLDSTASYDNIVDVEYSLIIDEYNNLSGRPTSKTQRDYFYEERRSKFTGSTDPNVNFIITLLSDPGTYLENINSSFKDLIDSKILIDSRETVLERMLLNIEYHLMENLSILTNPITYKLLGYPLRASLKEVLNFFKPYRVRIKDFSGMLIFDDPVDDSAIAEDLLYTALTLTFFDKGTYAFDDALVTDNCDAPVLSVGFNEYITNGPLDSIQLHDNFEIEEVV